MGLDYSNPQFGWAFQDWALEYVADIFTRIPIFLTMQENIKCFGD